MKSNKIFLAILATMMLRLYASSWVDLGESQPKPPTWNVNQISSENLEISFNLGGFHKHKLDNDKIKVTFPDGVSILEEGAPNLPRMARSFIIPDMAKMHLSVIEADFIEIQIDNIEPSKGNILRNQNPDLIPYTYGPSYEKDQLYPSEIVFLREPYILRAIRGQAVVFQPIQYNPIQRVLRVYTLIKVSVKQNGLGQINILERKPLNSPSKEFLNIYKDHFINYPETTERYEILSEQGSMLIISYGAFMEAMQPFVDWKNYKGMSTEIVDIADIGGISDVAQLIEEKYYEDGIAFVLLVGDINQIESIRRSDGDGSNTPSDNSFTFVAGDDYYPDLIIGRFSAETTEHVETMVNRTISYEMNPDTSNNWFNKGSGFASNEGPGDDDEYDNEHLDNIREQLLEYNYIEIDQVYDPNGTVEDGEQAINEGRSIINYTGHGSNGSWGNGCPMNSTNVNGLTNTGKWPFIWSVACVNGQFHQGTCFAETWLRATDVNGEPTGAIATLMSTVNQAWDPPMDGQDEMNAIFVESYSNNLKRTFGGLSFNGMNHMNDNYGSAGYNEVLYWTIFGDPSVVLRSDIPSEMDIVHNEFILIGETEFNVNAGLEGALVAISRDGELLESGFTNEFGEITVDLESSVEIPGEVNLVVTAYNKIPYEGTVNIISPEGAYIVMENTFVTSGVDSILDFGEEALIYTNFVNVGQDTSSDLTVSVSHEELMVNIITQELSCEPVPPGDTVSVGPFEFNVNWNVENGASIPFLFSVMDSSNIWEYSLDVDVQAPSYQLIALQIYDGGNGTLDPGENATLEITIKNVGSSPLSYPTFDSVVSDPYITFGDMQSNNAYWWDIDMLLNLTIQISASPNAPVGHSLVSGLLIGSLNTPYQHTFPVPITLGIMTEDFETGDLSSLSWGHGGNANWIIDSESYSGDFSVRSGDIGHSQTSELHLMMNIIYEGEIRFWAKASSEQGASGIYYDYLDFHINGESQGLAIGGDSDWNEYSMILPVGEHRLSWIYAKDAAETYGQDCAWIDRIQFPPGAVVPLDIDFGDVNVDDTVNILDVIVAVNFIAGHINLSNEQTQNADMNLDGLIDIFDLLMIVEQVLID